MAAETWAPQGDFRWDHVEMNAAGRAWLDQQGLDRLAVDALLAEDTRPRVTVIGTGAVAVLRGVNLTEGAEPEDMISTRMWLAQDQVITVWRRPLRAIAQVQAAIQNGSMPVGTGAFVSRLAMGLGETASPVIARLGERVEALEEALFDDRVEVAQSELSDVRQMVIKLHRYFAPQAEAVRGLRKLEATWIASRDRTRLDEAADRMTRLTEELDALGQRAQVVQDHMAARRAEHMNQQMFVLSIAAALFLPLGFLTGLLGINVGGMPGVENPAGFWIVCVLLVVIAALQWWLFRRLGIVGRRG